ncbi:DNA-binding protein [Polyangium mundeleinium]|uniref:DNA-binding protein n=1 Tax=Polyangium mundeleinium TaxID=2995306 RepID=A0ABT5ER83_9BACT|nr:DNA-binding protein [Polyangium mundeleinium]MDC0743275.1 DNA-binding protein [Polyangium mundeleinium]
MHPRALLLVVPLAALLTGCGSDELPTADPLPAPEVVTIAEARALPVNEYTQIEGFVSVPAGTFVTATGDFGFAIQDDTGGIYVSLYEELKILIGAKIRVIGKIAQVSKQTVLVTNVTGPELLQGIEAVTPKDVATGEVNESTEGLLVRVKGTVSNPIVEDKPYGIKAYVDDGSGEVEVYVCFAGDKPLIDTTKLTKGTAVEITGFAQQYLDRYEIAPRGQTDLVLVPPPSP